MRYIPASLCEEYFSVAAIWHTIRRPIPHPLHLQVHVLALASYLSFTPSHLRYPRQVLTKRLGVPFYVKSQHDFEKAYSMGSQNRVRAEQQVRCSHPKVQWGFSPRGDLENVCQAVWYWWSVLVNLLACSHRFAELTSGTNLCPHHHG